MCNLIMSIYEKKKKLRSEILTKRKSISSTLKKQLDNRIFDRLIAYPPFISSNTVLVYYSVNDEINTEKIIDYCFRNGKKVALPVCVRNRVMVFYNIKSFFDLKEGKYNIPAPDTNICSPVEDFSDSICIVPGLCFGKKGERLGYGGGYYDSFLNENKLLSIGLCYDRFVFDSIPCEKHDIRLNTIITETSTIEI